MFWSLKKKPSHVAHVEMPRPSSFDSAGSPRSFDEAPVAMTTVSDSKVWSPAFTTNGRRVDVVHRRDSLRASKIMQERALKNPKIGFIWDTVVEDILDVERGKVTAVRLKNLKTRAQTEQPVDGLFVAIGHQPNTEIFRGQVELLPNDYIKVKPGSTETSVPGIFAAGDVQDFTFRQAVTAAGSGCMAALEAERYLEAAEGR